MARGHVVLKRAVKRRASCFYFVDAEGNVRETEMKRARKKGQGSRNDLCKPKKRRKRRR